MKRHIFDGYEEILGQLHTLGSASGWWEEHTTDWTFRLIEQCPSFTNPKAFAPLLRWLQCTRWR